MKLLAWIFAVTMLVLFSSVLAIVYTPASFIPQALEYANRNGYLPAQAQGLSLSSLSGTIWKGRAGQASVIIDGARLDLGELQWDIEASALLNEKLSVSLRTTAPDQQFQAHVFASATGDILVEGAEGFFPVELLEPWIPLLISGRLAFVVDRWEFNRTELVDIDGLLNLEYADWLGGDYPMSLGSYMAEVSMDNRDIAISINDFSSTLGVEGLISVKPSGNYRFRATLRPRDGLAPEVAESVAWFGKKNALGEILIDRRGKL